MTHNNSGMDQRQLLAPSARLKTKLPGWRILQESFGCVFGNLGRFFSLAWLPMLVTWVVSTDIPQILSIYGGRTVPKSLLAAVLVFLVDTAFVTRWLRYVLVDDRKSIFSEFLGHRHRRVVLYALPFFPLYLSPSSFADIAPLAIVLAAVWVRVGLIFPSIAIDRPIRLSDAWRNLRGNTWRTLSVVAITFAALSLYVGAFLGICVLQFESHGVVDVGTFFFEGIGWEINNVFGTITNVFTLAIALTFVSNSYRHLFRSELVSQDYSRGKFINRQSVRRIAKVPACIAAVWAYVVGLYLGESVGVAGWNLAMLLVFLPGWLLGWVMSWFFPREGPEQGIPD